jgi:aspartokinase-like uncharacterized kinase
MKRPADKRDLLSGAVVVKLGGSLAGSTDLKRWARILARATLPVVVVPGGGGFANAVREAQSFHRFPDATAHRMAILAMHQTGLMLAGMERRLIPAQSAAEIRAALAAGRIPVWLPLAMADRDRAIPADWSITSDGLAARLAERLRIPAVCLVKSRTVEARIEAETLVRRGIVDEQFAEIVTRAGLSWRIFGPGEETALSRLITVRVTEKRPLVAGKARRSGRRRTRGPHLARTHGVR